MDKTTQEKILEYERLKLEERDIKNKIDEIKSIITPHMERDKEINCRYGKIIFKHRPIWKHSEEVQAAEKEIKEIKKEEIAKGIAIDEGVDFIEYRTNK